MKPSKSWLIVKVEHLASSMETFAGCCIGITTAGKRHLDAGSWAFVEQYVSGKVDYWVSCVQKLGEIAKV